MAWKEKEVTNIELSKKLKELGFPQDSGWFWVLENFACRKLWKLRFLNIPYAIDNLKFKAYTCSELGEFLPMVIIKNNEYFYFDYFRIDDPEYIYKDKPHQIEYSRKYRPVGNPFKDICEEVLIRMRADTEANVRGKTAIWLKKNGYINFNSEVKK